MADGDSLRVGLIGYSFMGQAHSQAWRNVASFFDVPLRPEMAVLCGRDKDKTQMAADQLGWREVETDFRRLVERDDIDLIDICTPGSSHAEIAIAALQAGKHVLCEKPLARTSDEAVAMVAAAEEAAGTAQAMVAFNYRRVPAVAVARGLIADGRLGDIRHVRAQYLQDFLVDPDVPLMWRLVKEQAGSGALGDIGAHIIDLAQYLLDDRVQAVSGLLETFIEERPIQGTGSGLSGAAAEGGQMGRVTVDDASLFLVRFASGTVGTFEATRFATGHKNGLKIEVNGADGSLVFDLERLNELEFYDARQDGSEQGFRRILITEADHPWVGAWWPPGHVLGWEHTFVHEIHDLLHAVADGQQPVPSFADGLQVQRVLDAVEASAGDGRWHDVAS